MDYDSDAAWSLNPPAAVVSPPFMLSPLTRACVYVCQVPTDTKSQMLALDDIQKQRGLKHPLLTVNSALQVPC